MVQIGDATHKNLSLGEDVELLESSMHALLRIVKEKAHLQPY